MGRILKNLGGVSAYKAAVAGGYTGTEEEFDALLANVAIDLAEIENLSVTCTTLPAGSSATASYADGVLTLGLPQGAAGADGKDGADGVGVPAGGSTGQALVKKSGSDYDTEWGAAGAQIDDTAGTGDTNKVWSADKSYSEFSNVKSALSPATSDTYGTVKVYGGYGITMIDGKLACNAAAKSVIKAGDDQVKPIVVNHQHEAAFYGLAKAAGDSTQSASANAVGTYTAEAKAKIKAMLGIDEWELLVDATAAEDKQTWTINTGDSGQDFNNYNSLIVIMKNEPNTGGKTSRVNLYFNNSQSYSKPCLYDFNIGIAANACSIAIAQVDKMPFGLVPVYAYRTMNTSSAVGQLVRNNGTTYYIDAINNSDNMSIDIEDMFIGKTFDYIGLSGYEQAIGTGSQVMVYGRR